MLVKHHHPVIKGRGGSKRSLGILPLSARAKTPLIIGCINVALSLVTLTNHQLDRTSVGDLLVREVRIFDNIPLPRLIAVLAPSLSISQCCTS